MNYIGYHGSDDDEGVGENSVADNLCTIINLPVVHETKINY